MKELKSRRNVVLLDESVGIISKTFKHLEDYQKEKYMYEMLSKEYLPTVYSTQPKEIRMSYLDYPTYLDVLENQESTHYDITPWNQLIDYLEYLNNKIHEFPTDVNLRNFLWDASSNQLYAIDFEQYDHITIETCIIKLIAFIDLYDPVNSSVKQYIHELYATRYCIDPLDIHKEKERILQRRACK